LEACVCVCTEFGVLKCINSVHVYNVCLAVICMWHIHYMHCICIHDTDIHDIHDADNRGPVRRCAWYLSLSLIHCNACVLGMSGTHRFRIQLEMRY
jgi:hypothetical protein